jgi:NADH-quinone oxidoreductase subunit I
MVESAVSPAISARSSAPWTASPCKRPRTSRFPEWFRINFSRGIYCGFCEEACPTLAIQLTPDYEQSEYRREFMVYEKEDLLIDGPGKYPGYNYWRIAGVEIAGKRKGEGERESPPVDVRSLLP